MAAPLDKALDARLRDFIVVTEIDEMSGIADDLFRRKYAHPSPPYPHHVGVFWRDGDALRLAHFLHFFESGDMSLIGGACTDGEVVRRMPDAQRDAITATGGLMLQATRYGLAKFGPRKDAIFGHCGDARSFGVLMQAGFQPMDHPYLIAYWPRVLSQKRQQELFDWAIGLGPF